MMLAGKRHPLLLKSHCVPAQAIAKSYGAASVTYSEEAEKKIELYTRSGFDSLPICMAKTQYRSAQPWLANDCVLCCASYHPLQNPPPTVSAYPLRS